ncbi:MAG TPA: type IV pili twitching motility protein PilT, partial [Gammaproteobacteria bacterium]|nr:type IV pili twitching motility protein PilT [Gammaproteobacteria bacterium]
MEFADYLKLMVAKDASDLYLTVGAPPSMKIQGRLVPVENNPIPPGGTELIANKIMTKEQLEAFETNPEMNLAISERKIGRFRVNIFKQRSQVGLVIRNIKTQIPKMDELGMPPILTKL